MAGLSGKTVATTYHSLLKVSTSDNQNLTTSLQNIVDGEDTPSCLSLTKNTDALAVLSVDGDNAGGTQIQIDNSAADGDVSLAFQLSATTTWLMGIEDGDSDSLKICHDSTMGSDERLSFLTASTVFNEDSGDIDFRVEGNGDANLLFCDASTDRVGIGVATPLSALDILNTSTQLRLSYDATNYATFTIAADGLLNIVTVDGGGAEADICLNPDGNVGIGTVTPAHKLHIESASGDSCNLQVTAQGAMGDAEGAFITMSCTGNSVTTHSFFGVEYNGTSTSNKPAGVFQMESSDEVVHYTWYNDDDKLKWSTDRDHIGSNNGTFVDAAASDERGKNIASSFTYGLSHINQLIPISFTYKDDVDSVKNLGFGAQTTQSIIPESVIDTKMDWYDDPNNTRLDMKYTQIIPVLVKAIQELSVKVEALENA